MCRGVLSLVAKDEPYPGGYMTKTFEHQTVYLNVSANRSCECHSDKVDSPYLTHTEEKENIKEGV
jgi:hypothetical protein